jgi:hypothetical protein
LGVRVRARAEDHEFLREEWKSNFYIEKGIFYLRQGIKLFLVSHFPFRVFFIEKI